MINEITLGKYFHCSTTMIAGFWKLLLPRLFGTKIVVRDWDYVLTAYKYKNVLYVTNFGRSCSMISNKIFFITFLTLSFLFNKL